MEELGYKYTRRAVTKCHQLSPTAFFSLKEPGTKDLSWNDNISRRALETGWETERPAGDTVELKGHNWPPYTFCFASSLSIFKKFRRCKIHSWVMRLEGRRHWAGLGPFAIALRLVGVKGCLFQVVVDAFACKCECVLVNEKDTGFRWWALKVWTFFSHFMKCCRFF